MTKLSVALVQNNAREDWRNNLGRIENLLKKIRRKQTHLIALPEMFLFRGPTRLFSDIAKRATPEAIRFFRDYALQWKVSVLLGSVLEAQPRAKKFYNTSIYISSKGKITAKYRKIHLFDNALKSTAIQESKHYQAGRNLSVAREYSKCFGMSICYDVRFPELYRAYSKRGCEAAFIPANFTAKTGAAHWEVLIRARAIENQMFVLAPGQVGTHPTNKIKSFGKSLIVGPWGDVLTRGTVNREEILMAKLDFMKLRKLRKKMPALAHRRI